MSKTEDFNGVRMIPAECYRGCTDPECPYTHKSVWVADLDPKHWWNTREDAVKYARVLGEYNV